MRIILLLNSFLLLAFHSYAQQTFRGRVVDADTGEPLPYASIYVAEGKGTLTNGDGEFTIEMSATENIKISYLGYKTVFITNPEPSMSIRMKALPRQLREVEVYAVNVNKVLKGVIKQLIPCTLPAVSSVSRAVSWWRSRPNRAVGNLSSPLCQTTTLALASPSHGARAARCS